MNGTPRLRADQVLPGDADHAPAFQCAGCAHWFALPAALVRAGEYTAPVCVSCVQRGEASTVWRDVLRRAVAAGSTVPHVTECFARMGLEVPTTAAAAARAARSILARTAGR